MPNHCYNEIQIVSDKGLEPIRKLIVNENKLPIEEWTELNKDTQLIDFNLEMLVLIAQYILIENPQELLRMRWLHELRSSSS